MKKVFITRMIPEKGIQLLKGKNYKVVVSPYQRVLTKKELIKMAKGFDALLCLLTDKINDRVLEGIGPQLKIVANMAVGFDNIDVQACRRRNIIVTNTPDVLTETVAEHAFALILSLARRIVEADAFLRSNKYKGWEPMLLLGSDVYGKTLGIVGLGRIGKALAKRAVKGFGMKVMYADVKKDQDFEKEFNAEYADLNAILETADFISLHVPLLESTRHLIGKEQLAMMKKTAFLINTSRGAVIDEKALTRALKNKEIQGAGLDVFEFEPKLTKGLSKIFNVIITPHVASATRETRDKMAQMAAQNIIAVLEGDRPSNVV